MAKGAGAISAFDNDFWGTASTAAPPNGARELVDEQTEEHFYNVPASDYMYNKLASRLAGVENIGEYLGSFPTYTGLPAFINDAYFTDNDRTANKNDFVTVINNNIPDTSDPSYGKQRRYVISGVNPDTGAITWTPDIIYGTDATNKQDKAENNGNVNIAVFSGTGLQSSVSSGIRLDDIVLKGRIGRVSFKCLAGLLSREIGNVTQNCYRYEYPDVDHLPGIIVYDIDVTTGMWVLGRANYVSRDFDSNTVPAYSSIEQYHFNDIVTYNSRVYLARKDVVGVSPVDASTTSNWWYLGQYLEGIACYEVETIAVGGKDIDIGDVISKIAASVKVSDQLSTSVNGTANIAYAILADELTPLIGTVVFDTIRRVIGRVTGFYQAPTATTSYITVETTSVLGHTFTSIPLNS